MLACVLAVVGCAEGGENQDATGGGGIAWTTSQTGGSGGAGGSGASTGGGGVGGTASAPVVTAIDPADGTTGVAANTSISVTFSMAMDPATATTSDATTCSGTLQISRDGFSSCVVMNGAPTSSDNLTFVLSPATPLGSAERYQLRATEDLAAAAGGWLTPFESMGFTTRYAHTIAIDGTNDFVAAEEIASSTSGAKIYVGIDDTHLYVGLEHVDIVTGGTGDKFVYFLFSTDPSLTDGFATSSDDKAEFGTGANMMFHYKHQIDGGNYVEHSTADGSGWTTNWTTTGQSNKASGYLEASFALSDFGTGVTDILLTTYTIDYAGQGGEGHLYNMLPLAVEGSGVPARDLVQYVHLRLPTSTSPGDASLLQSF